MAKPRVFVSSTFYDLRQVRNDLERFIHDMGYDPVLNERGHIPYGPTQKLEQYAYEEVLQCNILIAIIGGRYGTESEIKSYSISNIELKTAHERGMQIFIFIDKSVWSEYQTYKLNKEAETVKYHHVDDVRVYKFIEEIDNLPLGNPISQFESSHDIVSILREQWAGLFHRYLKEQARARDIDLTEKLTAGLQSLHALVANVTSTLDQEKDKAILEPYLLMNHPLFFALRKTLSIQHRIFFTTKQELLEWLKSEDFDPIDPKFWDNDDYMEYILQIHSEGAYLLKIYEPLFDTRGNLIPLPQPDWEDSFVKFAALAEEPEPNAPRVPDFEPAGEEDDLPF